MAGVVSTHRANLDVQRPACHLLANLAFVDACKAPIIAVPSISLIAVAMQDHAGSAELYIRCCCALINLAGFANGVHVLASEAVQDSSIRHAETCG